MTRTSTERTRIAGTVSVFASVTAALALLLGSLPAANAAGATTVPTTPLAATSSTAKSPATKAQAAHRAAARKATRVAAARSARTASATDFASIFSGDNANLANSGWATCPSPITWSIDASELSPDAASRELVNLQWAFDQWATAAGLTFQYSGSTEVTYTDAGYAVAPADGSALAPRHIYLTNLSIGEASMLNAKTIGFGSPSRVMAAAREIVGGYAVFRTDYVEATGPQATAHTKALFLHELGHVLGLAHATQTANVMHPIVDDHIDLGLGDTNGVRGMTKPCSTPGTSTQAA